MKSIGSLSGDAIGISPRRTISEAARLMDLYGVTELVVVDGAEVCGVVTNGDLVRRALSSSIPPSILPVGGVLEVSTVTEDAIIDGFEREASAFG